MPQASNPRRRSQFVWIMRKLFQIGTFLAACSTLIVMVGIALSLILLVGWLQGRNRKEKA